MGLTYSGKQELVTETATLLYTTLVPIETLTKSVAPRPLK